MTILGVVDVEREESLDLLDATHDFPCRFTLKVIGASADEFVERVIAAVQDDDKLDADFPVSVRETPQGRHVAITMEPTLISASHVLEVYARIRLIEGVVMTM